MCLTCILFYLLSGALGLLLGWLIFRKKESENKLINESLNHKNSFEELLVKFQEHKNSSHEKLLLKDAQLTKVNSELAELKEGGPPQVDEENINEVKELRNKIKNLETELNASPEDQMIPDEKWEDVRDRLQKIKTEYSESQNLIQKLRKENDKYARKVNTSKKTTDNRVLKFKEKNIALKERIKQKNKELIQLKSSFKKQYKAFKELTKKLLENAEIRDSLNMKKLMSLLRKGKLSAVNKKSSGKKAN